MIWKTLEVTAGIRRLLFVPTAIIFRLTAVPLGNEIFQKGGFWEYPDQTV